MGRPPVVKTSDPLLFTYRCAPLGRLDTANYKRAPLARPSTISL